MLPLLEKFTEASHTAELDQAGVNVSMARKIESIVLSCETYDWQCAAASLLAFCGADADEVGLVGRDGWC